MKHILIVFLLSTIFYLGQKSAKGNYLAIDQWGISFIELKNHNKIEWYTSGCKDRGTDKIGSWIQKGDSIEIDINNDVNTFIIMNNSLCYLDDEGKLKSNMEFKKQLSEQSGEFTKKRKE